ncbi:MAG: pyridoxal phosphate-dependent aminotransferase [Desulfovibrionaceae bacterium]|nr:pyridoxal phosphate-dependent aminotransferase [Desulfovibrionaceae bacterium]
MQLLSETVQGYLANSSMIRRMFEAGIELRKKYGPENVYDFSLGNPDLPAPARVVDGLKAFAEKADQPFAFGYTPNAGAPWAREALAKWLSEDQGVSLEAGDVLISVGAASALNAVLKAIFNPGEELLTFAPYFVEYGFYVSNHGGVLSTVPSRPETFAPDVEALEKAMSPKTRAVLINSPHNPTGAVYTLEELKEICALLERKSEEYGHPVWLISDEPYRFLAYDGIEVPSVLPLYRFAVCVSSFSKNLSLPGERIGYAALSPLLENRAEFMAALTLTNRILGYVNAPIVGQHIMVAALGASVDVDIYTRRRNAMAEVLAEAGYEFNLPRGSFYFFPKAPGGDDKAFIAALTQECVLGVPGSGFGCPGYFRLAFCVDEDIIRRSAKGFAAARRKFA